jgi:transglutaminase-like putative cysteine protease
MAIWLEQRLRPYLGWAVLLGCMMLSALPAAALRTNKWVELGSTQTALEFIGPVAVAAVWWANGWRTPRRTRRARWLWLLWLWLLFLAAGVLYVTQIAGKWIPSVGELWRAAVGNGWTALAAAIVDDWAHMVTRAALWWQGVQAGGAAQDNLVFAAIGGSLLWVVGILTAWLARRYHQGFLAAAPSLWLLGTILLYSSTGRGLLLTGLALAILLQLVLDNESLQRRWRASRLDFNPSLIIDRLAAVAGAMIVVLIVAAVMPNLYIRPIVVWYYDMSAPWNERLEDFVERMFPEVRGTSRSGGAGLAGGLPNEFLLRAGPELGDAEVMRVRTNESSGYEYPFMEEAPPGHYMRGGTLTVYNGRGWSNPRELERVEITADERWTARELPGRKLLVQSVVLTFRSQVLYAAPEPLEASTDFRLETRETGDLVALWAREPSYTIVSAIPAVNEEMLNALPVWGEGAELPEGYEVHLQLPETITERTRQLAAELTEGQETPFAKAQAIETYLRTYEYDLTVSEPPAEVTDIADYFLFDLRRGYCDYYASAFVVLARLTGLPTRFATGFAVGHWDGADMSWIITESEAHSWPEVYFPEYGWIPFEPTAGRPELSRIAAPQFSTGVAGSAQPVEAEAEAEPTTGWNWQMLVWLIPVAAVVWGISKAARRWQFRREDPWQALLRWGQRAGRPIGDGETVLEYGEELAGYVLQQQEGEFDAGRQVAREVTALSGEVSALRYGPEEQRSLAVQQAFAHWNRLRAYLPGLRLRRA